MFLGEFRSRAQTEPELTVLVRLLDAAGCRHSSDSGEDFATAIIAELAPPRLKLVRCGHHFPVLAEGSGVRLIETAPSLPLGLGGEHIAEEVTLSSQARLLFYTDGALESRDEKGHEFNLEESFSGNVGAGELEDIADAILLDLQRHTGKNINDDVVLLLSQVGPKQAETD